MSLADAHPFDLPRLLAGFTETTPPAIAVGGLVHDSRHIQAGDGFIALRGQRVHGLAHAGQAIQNGCAAILYEPQGGGTELAGAIASVPCVPVADLAGKIGPIADRFFGEPSRGFDALIGITGTNGKTSCSHFLAQALDNSSAVLGTLGWGRPGALQPTTHTTPDAIEVHRILGELLGLGFRSVAMEASSHGLEQGRLNGVRFKGALYTNFTRDHLDYHGSMEAYLEAKLRLLAWPGLEFVVFNADDASAETILARKPSAVRAIGFGKTGRERQSSLPFLEIREVRHETGGVSFVAHYAGASARVRAPVFGDYNVENLAATLGVLLALGWDLAPAADALGRVRAVPGRMESFAGHGRHVVVDYAHTPDALASVLRSLRGHCAGRLWVVFGCGGDRDRGKRPQMGAIAEQLADHVVLTDDNPRSEDGDAILRDILTGCRRDGLVCLRDRRAAIAHALEHAAPEDLVLVAGKGHESTQEIQGHKYPFSDRQVIQALLTTLPFSTTRSL
ncbi:UDP-N-acetylmuramoyl-L-alanyl-D-glutamate--2,6-diaminopimelate ligase [Methylomagnum ishizawai]|uniref:UDP-N-acetylmuramoyl-L-alanyl-D-glutamate--2, 6-diaminopimelate ligase n=1 Tax=Methylomagnum ishizawai TaxID=1760988 RepID=UPI001C34055B|nr:UDP-N-acetylmuramoyl-L-alanyl-D-glutamate--2,6-diaminopimelate ligase [Methylomagnum ishizawai]BBL73543.1 UDP-N-acetylmuramoyl-L-alanyl-D-glutamate--2,6-diaminopimelate ligase [Methylomagnum ishizawai]